MEPELNQHSNTVRSICLLMEELAPLGLAETWDNVGLLIGDRDRPVFRLMTCLTAGESVIAEAIAKEADMIIAHHPLPFRPIQRITADDPTGRLIWLLATNGISLYCPHTAWDNAADGINDQLAHQLSLQGIAPLVVRGRDDVGAYYGSARVGTCHSHVTAEQLAIRVQQQLKLPSYQLIGNADRSVSRVAIVCGSGASFLEAAQSSGCDLLITGEANYHQCLEAIHRGVNMILLGHHGSERFSMEVLANRLQERMRELVVWASEAEFDPSGTSVHL